MEALCLTSMNLFRSCLVARRCQCLLFSFLHSVLSIFVSRFVYWRRNVIVGCSTPLLWTMVSRWARTRCDPRSQFSLLIFIFFSFLVLFFSAFFRVFVSECKTRFFLFAAKYFSFSLIIDCIIMRTNSENNQMMSHWRATPSIRW